jgi:CheY-like chemotaxis protein
MVEGSSINRMLRILLVDDDPDTIMTCKLGLMLDSVTPSGATGTSDNFLSIDAYTNPELALEKFRQDCHSYDLVISDVRMPLLSGFELAKKLREIVLDIPILFMSGFEISPAEYREWHSITNSAIFIDKPFRISTLTAKISRVAKTKVSTRK